MSKKTSLEHLRSMIESMEAQSKDELLEFIDAISEEISELKTDIKDAESERDLIQAELDDLPDTAEEFLGLDTINYNFEKGNLRIQSQFEEWVNNIQQQNSVTNG